MNGFIAALPMYDRPEMRAETDGQWRAIRDRLRAAGIAAPERLVRCNADMPAVPGGIRDGDGMVVAPDPAMLPPDELDLATLWRHPALVLAQTCWGPIENGLGAFVAVVGQPDYSAYAGGAGELYSSAIVMRGSLCRNGEGGVPSPADGLALLPLEAMRGKRLAFNGPDSMSGLIALARDLEAAGEGLFVFSETIETGSHAASVAAVAEGRADVCAVDCRSWALLTRFEPRARDVGVVGWTARRKGLPYVAAAGLGNLHAPVRGALAAAGPWSEPAPRA